MFRRFALRANLCDSSEPDSFVQITHGKHLMQYSQKLMDSIREKWILLGSLTFATGLGFIQMKFPVPHQSVNVNLAHSVTRQYRLDGFHSAESWGRWTDKEHAQVIFLQALPHHFRVRFRAQVLPSLVNQPVRVRCGALDQNVYPTTTLQDYQLEFYNARCRSLVFITKLKSPSELGLSNDTRLLGVGLTNLQLEER